MISLLKKTVGGLLGRNRPGSISPYRPPAHLLLENFVPALTQECRKGALVFALQFAPKGGGGLADVLHLGCELERQYGFSVFYHVTGPQDYASVCDSITWTNSAISAARILRSIDFAPEILCATAWPTAYEILKIPSGRKLYFVQDYEPWFLKAGSPRWYAEKSYTLGHEMFTLGPWLAHHLESTYNVKAAPMPFPAADATDLGGPLGGRKTVAVYLQPDKEHRGTDLLLTACRNVAPEIAKRDWKFVMFGSQQNPWINPGFPCEIRGILSEPELKAMMAETRLGISTSFTNISLMPFRWLRRGIPVVELNLPNVAESVPEAVRPMMFLAEPEANSVCRQVQNAAGIVPDDAVRRTAADWLERHHDWRACAASLRTAMEPK